MIHNVLTTPLPMYEIADWLKLLYEETLGLSSGESSLIGDDRVGKALESSHFCRHKAIKLFEID